MSLIYEHWIINLWICVYVYVFCVCTDLWVNCKELHMDHPSWLCQDKSKEGLRRRKHCRATCACQKKMYNMYTF